MTEEALFQETLSRSPEERAVFLAKACAGRPELRAAVEALLAAHEKPGNVLDKPPADLGQTVDPDPGEARGAADGDFALEPGAASAEPATNDHRPEMGPVVIAGRYVLQRQIGEGGMGEVWVAKQTEPVKRKVALKLIKAGMDSKAVLGRFEQERQALALMDHPNIAKVLDGGLTPDRRPFFVMELVNGLPLTRFCDDAKLGIRERLELFTPICQAVQHAHQKGIIHRDLKPSNILVTIIDGRGVPKVIDFGVSKAVAGKLTDESLSTQFGAVVGTLEYMAPEQASFASEDIDTRADIYSLGVILYELLTGLRPIDAKRLKKAAFTEMIRLIKEEEPSKPSTRLSTDESGPSVAALRHTEPRKLAALLRGELDWVVMKCLEKSRDRRYQTANGLARDIQRYLANDVVEARPPSASYRLHKFARKHRLALATAGMFALVLIATTAFSAWQAHRAGEAEKTARESEAEALAQRNTAEDNFKKAREAVDEYFTRVSESKLLNVPGLQPLRKDLLESARKYYEQFLRDRGGDKTVRAEAAEAWYRLGFVQMEVGTPAEAARDFQQAVAMYEALARDHPDEPRYPYKLAMALNDLGNQQARLGTLTEARRTADRSLEIRRRVAREHPTVLDYQKELAIGLTVCGSRSQTAGRMAEAMPFYLEARDLYERLIRDYPDVADYRYRLSGVLRSIGTVQETIGRTEQALQAIGKASDLLEGVVREHPEVLAFQFTLANTLRWNGQIYHRRTESPAEAIPYYRRAIEHYERLVRQNPEVKTYPLQLAYSFCYLAQVLRKTGQGPKALELSRKAMALFERIDKEEGLAGLYDRACIRSLSSELVKWGGADSAADDRSRRLADRAMDALRQAVAGGYSDLVWIEKDTDLDPLRARDDFKKLIAELEKKSTAKPEKKP
jgi:serine/threonine protein kinase/tetratricopeptide (TPR) repeat protein